MHEYIEREALLRYLNDIWLTATPTDSMPDDDRQLAITRCTGLNDAMDAVKDAPAADVVPVRHGYWIEGEKKYRHNWGSITVRQCNCSQCDYTQESSIWGGSISDGIKKTNYCPNCGARMDGET